MHRQWSAVVAGDEQFLEQVWILDIAEVHQDGRARLAKRRDGAGGALASSMAVREEAKAKRGRRTRWDQRHAVERIAGLVRSVGAPASRGWCR
jgi:hypothetical protein